MAVVGNGGEGGDKYGFNGDGSGHAAQGSRAVGVVILEQELGGDRGHSKSIIGIPSLVREKYYGGDGAAYNKRRVGVDPGA